MRSAWTGPPAPIPNRPTGWDTWLVPIASLALTVSLNATRKVKSLRVKIKSCKEVDHIDKVWLVILQGTQSVI